MDIYRGEVITVEKQQNPDPDQFWDLSKDIRRPDRPAGNRDGSALSLADIRMGSVPSHPEAGSVTVEPLPVPPQPPIPLRPDETPQSVPETVRSGTQPLILSAQVFRLNQKYHFYDDFRQQALRFRTWTGQECPRMPYFSFLPQYMQLSTSQRDWYFFWRDEFRRGRYPDTDYSYLLLFGYELINLMDVQPPEQTLRELCSVWTAYRERCPRLDSFMPDWIMDLCLITGQPVPEACACILETPELFEKVEIPEFFLDSGTHPLTAVRILQNYSKYDYRKSMYYRKSNDRTDYAAFYDRYFLPACASGIPALFRLLRERAVPSVLERDAFPGAICSSSVKRRLKISYISLRNLTSLREQITLMFRHTENGIRTLLNLPSRLASGKLDPSVSSVMNLYFSELTKKLSGSAERNRLKRNDDKSGDGVDYAGKYELPYTPLSAENARKIENESWKTTERLVEALDGEVTEETPDGSSFVPAAPAGTGPETEAPGSLYDLLHKAGLYPLCAALCEGGSARFRTLCEKQGVLPDSVVNEANELALSTLEDIIIESEGPGSYAVVPDYLDEWYQPGT